MKRYVGTKSVMAEPQVCQRDVHKSKKGDSGYVVVYDDGYVSWSPAEPFEKAYRPAEGLTFGMALEVLKLGKKVGLPYWSKDVHLELQRPDSNSKMSHAYVYIVSRWGLVPWVPTQVELLSDQWQVV